MIFEGPIASDGAQPLALHVSDGAPVLLPDAALLFRAEFERAGPDLLLRNDGAQDVLIVDYFRGDPVDLMSPEGGVLRGALVEKLAGPEAPGQYAQAGAAQGAIPIGQVESLEGTASVQRADGMAEDLAVGELVFQNDVVSSGAGSVTTLTFVDGTIFTLSASSRIVLDALIYDPSGDENSATFSLVEGGFVFVAGQVARTGGIEIQTPAATMGIRGTTLQMEVDTTLGTLSVQLLPDQNGDIGSAVVFDPVTGEVLATVSITGQEYIFDPGSTEEVRIERLVGDEPNELAAELSAAFDAQNRAAARLDAEGTAISIGSPGSQSTDEETPGGDPFDTGVEDPLGEIPPSLPDEGGGGGPAGGAPEAVPEETTPPPEIPAPDVQDETRVIEEDGSVTGRLRVDGDTDVAFTLLSSPENGALSFLPDGTFSFRPDPNFDGVDSFTFEVRSQLTGESDTATVTFDVTPVNDAPEVPATEVDLREDASTSGTLLARDVDSETLTYVVVDAPSNGRLQLSPDGAFDYTPAPDFAGTDFFTFEVSDGEGGVTPGRVSIEVAQVNDRPETENASAETDEDNAVSGTLAARDVDDSTLSFELVSQAENGSVSLTSGGRFTYTPDADFNGTDSFAFRVGDGEAFSETAVVEIAIAAVNDRPEAADVAVEGAEGTTLSGRFDARDPEGTALDFGIVDGPEIGSVSIGEDGSFSFSAPEDFSGTQSFSYTASDGDLTSAPATVTLTVTPLNDPPTAESVSVSGDEDTTLTGTLRASDVDGDDLFYGIGAAPRSGSASVGESGGFRYTPAPDFAGSDSFTIVVSDGQGGSTTATIRVTVDEVNDDPVAADVTLGTQEDTALSTSLAGAVSDVDGDALTFAVLTGPEAGELTLTEAGALTYTPAENFVGDVRFTYVVDDGRGGTAQAEGRIVVGGENDAPTLDPLALNVDEDGATGGIATATDPEDDPITYRLGDPASDGQAEVAVDGTLSYVPDPDFFGTDSFAVIASDGLADSVPLVVTVTVNPVNDVPKVGPLTLAVAEDGQGSAQLAATDVETPSDALTFRVTDGPANGALLEFNADGSFTYRPNPDFDGTDAFTVVASDGEDDSAPALVTITVGGENDAPVATRTEITLPEDGARDGAVTAFDADGDNLTFRLVTGEGAGPFNGAVRLDPDGAFTYTPDADFNGADRFEVVASDGLADSAPVRVSITVTAQDDPPVAQSLTLDTAEDSAVRGQVTAQDVDTPQEQLTFRVAGDGPARGDLDFGADGSFLYAPDPDFNGAVSFDVVANDGTSDGPVATVTIDVDARNDPPVATGPAAPLLAEEDGAATGQVTATDPDGDALSFAIWPGDGEVDGAPRNGSVDLDPRTGAFTYTPDADFNGTDSFQIVANDSTVDSAPVTVTVSIAPVNDPPVATGGALRTAEDRNVSGQVTAQDADTPQEQLAFRVLGDGPSHGTLLTFNAATGAFTYAPDADFNGSDAFRVVANDGGADSAPVTLTIEVTPQNDAPVASGAFVQIEQGDLPVGPLGIIAVADPDAGDSARFAILGDGAANGQAGVDPATGAFTYTPNAGFVGIDGFDVVVTDDANATGTARVSVAVGAAEVVTQTGQDLSLEINADGSDGRPAGNVGVFATAPTPVTVNFVIVIDASGSVSPDWPLVVSELQAATQELAAIYGPSQTNIDAQLVIYGSTARIEGLPDSEGAATTRPYRLGDPGDLAALQAVLGALPTPTFTDLTNFADAFLKTREYLDQANAATDGSSEENFVYFLTDGTPTVGGDFVPELERLTSNEDYGVTIEAFGIGSSVSVPTLELIDSEDDPILDLEPGQLAPAFGATALFAAELVSFSLELLADGEAKGVIATNGDDAFFEGGLVNTLVLGEVEGIADLLGEQNVLQATAVFDTDGDLTTTADRETLVETGALSIGTQVRSGGGTDGNDVQFGSVGDDAFGGGAGADLLISGGGDDTLTGGSGVDSLIGGAGDDRLIADTPEAGERYDGGAGRDVLEVVLGQDSAPDLLPSLDLRGINALDLANGTIDALALTAADVEDIFDGRDVALEGLLASVAEISATITGDTGDTATLIGAAETGRTVSTSDGTLDIYTFSDGSGELLATLAVDQDIAVTIPSS